MVLEGEHQAADERTGVAIRRVHVQKMRGDRVADADDALVIEEPLEIRVGRAEDRSGRPFSLSVTMRTPGNDFELAAGFLFTEGIVRSRDDIASVGYARTHVQGPSENVVDVILQRGVPFDPARFERHFYTTSSCGVCGKASLDALRVLGIRAVPERSPRVPANLLATLPERLREAQAVFATTGGLHAAGLFSTGGELLSIREDIGRHNAVDKLVGERLLAGRMPVRDGILAVSGRAGFEILQKAAVAGIPMVVSVGAPSSLAVDLAREYGMTLAGFVREHGFNVYAGGERIVPPSRSEPEA